MYLYYLSIPKASFLAHLLFLDIAFKLFLNFYFIHSASTYRRFVGVLLLAFLAT